MDTDFFIKSKTENYKEHMHNLEYAECDSFRIKETVILSNIFAEIQVSFDFYIYYLFDGFYDTNFTIIWTFHFSDIYII